MFVVSISLSHRVGLVVVCLGAADVSCIASFVRQQEIGKRNRPCGCSLIDSQTLGWTIIMRHFFCDKDNVVEHGPVIK